MSKQKGGSQGKEVQPMIKIIRDQQLVVAGESTGDLCTGHILTFENEFCTRTPLLIWKYVSHTWCFNQLRAFLSLSTASHCCCHVFNGMHFVSSEPLQLALSFPYLVTLTKQRWMEVRELAVFVLVCVLYVSYALVSQQFDSFLSLACIVLGPQLRKPTNNSCPNDQFEAVRHHRRQRRHQNRHPQARLQLGVCGHPDDRSASQAKAIRPTS